MAHTRSELDLITWLQLSCSGSCKTLKTLSLSLCAGFGALNATF